MPTKPEKPKGASPVRAATKKSPPVKKDDKPPVSLPQIGTPKSSTPKSSPTKSSTSPKMQKMPSLDKTELTPRMTNANTIEKAATEQAAAEKEAAEKEAAAKEAAERAAKRNGTVILKYEMYSEEFPIVEGSTTMAAIDDVYALTFVMPNCLIHLSRWDPPTKVEMESRDAMNVYVREDPIGTYQDLEAGETYYVYAEQEAEQLAKDQAKMRQVAATMDGAAWTAPSTTETCSCVNGNPCVDEYNCKDWHNRFAVATTHGWKGF
ncbi:hypothetical protein SPRG_00200 [Saprolegnia parasitica CBS 223.65]|uniref:Uncharacterized protein n=1 Tax=Saprolegnia parasitica (strain CBS 223.65) TaxID=695850 RepID=A0A067D9L5_SAPPC|nr:hypothetical protein SPRG_00200 [Saprolegnia parasitica CBS 223.65]KDO35351.1 hypothetical protein SPRG_00200 [Saprolegnia parasitica CBS 223.65]|eukprot:XP_012193697.1 hypothetical protein SPRG_00200 [Saprolegnia parasitica CBS 223.65]